MVQSDLPETTDDFEDPVPGEFISIQGMGARTDSRGVGQNATRGKGSKGKV